MNVFYTVFDGLEQKSPKSARNILCIPKDIITCRKSKNMGKTYYNISRKKDAAGESEICMRIYVSKDNRIRIGSGIWVEAKRWGKKNEINIPNIPGEEREMLLEKRAKLKALTEHIEKEIQTAEEVVFQTVCPE